MFDWKELDSRTRIRIRIEINDYHFNHLVGGRYYFHFDSKKKKENASIFQNPISTALVFKIHSNSNFHSSYEPNISKDMAIPTPILLHSNSGFNRELNITSISLFSSVTLYN